MAFINPSLKKNQEIITKVWGNTMEKLTNDLKYVVHVFCYQSTLSYVLLASVLLKEKK